MTNYIATVWIERSMEIVKHAVMDLPMDHVNALMTLMDQGLHMDKEICTSYSVYMLMQLHG